MASKDPIREQPPPQGIEIKATQDQFFGFYRGIAPGVTGSLATGATYFGVIESTKKWIEESHPNLGGHLVHFIAGAIVLQSNMPNPLSKTSPPITPTKRRIRIIAIAPYSNTVTILNPPVQNGEHQS
uniref:Uncharacterized protein n=1 Tax=Brassica oleracea var. oleracea TaxID=109376 RepID=A0A0D3B7L6_BRAOL